MATALSIAVLAVLALLGGAVWLWRRGGSRKQAALLLLLAAILAGNVAIWTVPDASGSSPLERRPE